MIRHRKNLGEASAPSAAGEVTPQQWSAPHLAFDTLAAAIMPHTLVAANSPIGGSAIAPIEISAGADVGWRTRYDFSFVDFVRLTCSAAFPSSANAYLGAQWSDDEGVTWNWFGIGQQPQLWNGNPAWPGGPYNGGAMQSPWTSVVPAAKRDVLVRFVGWGALGGDPPVNWGAMALWAR